MARPPQSPTFMPEDPKVFHAYARKDWGALVIEVLAGVVTAYFVLMPNSAVAMLQAFATGIFGA